MRTASFFSLICVGFGTIAAAQAETLAAPDRSGFYMGADVGGARGIAHAHANVPTNSSSYFISTDFDQVQNAGDGSNSQSRPLGGIHGGYGKRLGNMLIGIEVNATMLNLDDSRSETVTYLTAPADQFTLKQSLKADWLASLRCRLGWTQGPWLAYATGGLATTRIKLDTTFNDTFGSGASAHDSSSKTKAGWALGVGGEYALNNNWSVRGEFIHYDFGNVDSSAIVTNPSSAGLSNVINSKADLEINTLSVGVTYRFNAY